MFNCTSICSRQFLDKYKNLVFLNISGRYGSRLSMFISPTMMIISLCLGVVQNVQQYVYPARTGMPATGGRSKTYYETLNVSSDCTSKEVREAFIALSKQCHPDKNRGNPKAQEEFIKVTEAYNVLIKPDSRRDYDSALQYKSQSRTYKNTNKGDFYEVHRYDSYYRDPWKDPSFARNRNFYNENKDNYYGVDGVRKQTNNKILVWVMIFFSIGFLIQILMIRFTRVRQAENLRRMNEENSRHLESARARAEMYGSRERQIEEYIRRLNMQKPDE